jgi:hypothetical protein
LIAWVRLLVLQPQVGGRWVAQPRVCLCGAGSEVDGAEQIEVFPDRGEAGLDVIRGHALDRAHHCHRGLGLPAIIAECDPDADVARGDLLPGDAEA